jgi:1-aminocyclopropane-1-carboxylate deaminase
MRVMRSVIGDSTAQHPRPRRHGAALPRGTDPPVRADGGDGRGTPGGAQGRPDEAATTGSTPYAIPAGASDHQLGGLGFANWAYEVEQQERELGVFFETIVVCAVTGSTQAGMIAGFAGQQRPRRVIGIDASAKLKETTDQVERIARATAELIELGRDLRDDEITVLEGWAGDLYGVPGRSTIDAILLTAQLEGMIIDTSAASQP